MGRFTAIECLGVLALLAGCTHAPSFVREGSPSIIGDGPALEPVARVALITSARPGFEQALERAARLNGTVAIVAPDAAPEYVVRVNVERRARASAANFLLCWPGFLVFAPAWHGLDWAYRVDAVITIDQPTGDRVETCELESSWTARYTARHQGIEAGLAWYPPLYTLPAIEAGIESSIRGPDADVLDGAFFEREGELWAQEVMARIAVAIEHDREQHPVSPEQ
jgi:hypothetical protein